MVGQPKMNTLQPNLFTQMEKLQTLVISRRKDFDSLFEGFTKLRAISYVVSPDLLLEFFEGGYEEVEVLVGENLAEPYRQGLAQKDRALTQQLSELIEKGVLRIFVPKQTIHTKLYLLEGPSVSRVILTSANLTETAQRASGQTNYAWYADLSCDDPWFSRVNKDYQTHMKGCSLFMSDLMELFQKRTHDSRVDLIEAWLKGGIANQEEFETKKAVQDIIREALQPTSLQEEPVFVFTLPESTHARKQVEQLIKPLASSKNGNEVQLNRGHFLTYVHEEYLGIPLMHADVERREVRLGINGAVNVLTEPLPDSATINRALEHIEDYIQTVERGQTRDSLFVKRCMFEALLYILSAPFAHEHMKILRRLTGAFESRGPRFLYIYGDSQNGKTTFLRFAMKLITGQVMKPLSGNQFSSKKLPPILSTVFPLLFDDVTTSQRKALEKIFKSYWESLWTPEYAYPQIILTSNAYNLPEWAKSRSLRLHFDVHFPRTEAGVKVLAELLTRNNKIFKWFSHLYLNRLETYEPSSEDELELARDVTRKIYASADRMVPEYFPQRPIEELYDMGRQGWLDLLYASKKAHMRRVQGRFFIDFLEDMTISEVNEYRGLLPQVVKSKREGKTLLIESPKQFDAWLKSQENDHGRPWPRRVFNLFKR